MKIIKITLLILNAVLVEIHKNRIAKVGKLFINICKYKKMSLLSEIVIFY
jgi:hypothetical protein